MSRNLFASLPFVSENADGFTGVVDGVGFVMFGQPGHPGRVVVMQRWTILGTAEYDIFRGDVRVGVASNSLEAVDYAQYVYRGVILL